MLYTLFATARGRGGLRGLCVGDISLTTNEILISDACSSLLEWFENINKRYRAALEYNVFLSAIETKNIIRKQHRKFSFVNSYMA